MTADGCVLAPDGGVSSIEGGLSAPVGFVSMGDTRELVGNGCVLSAVVFGLADVRGELFGGAREERAVTDDPSARVRFDADDGRAIGDVGYECAAVGRAQAAVLCARAAVVDAVTEDGGRRGETSGTLAADVCDSAAVVCDSAAVVDGMFATDGEVRDY